MTHIDLFAGIGGFSLAAREMGWHTVAWCEKDPFCQRVLAHHFPDADGHGDITKTDFTPYANRIDILTGGFPCQPFSTAGLRKGTEDDRHLWPEMLRAIREIKPRCIVGENVSGLANWDGGMVLRQIKAALEAEGYEVCVLDLPAIGVDAIHIRSRIWIVANRKELQQREQAERRIRPQPGNGAGPAAYPLCARWRQQQLAGKPAQPGHTACVADGRDPDPTGKRREDGKHGRRGENPEEDGARVVAELERLGSQQPPTDPAGQRGGEVDRAGEAGQPDPTGAPHDWGALYAEPPVYAGDDGLPDRLDRSRFPATVRNPESWLRRQSIKGSGNAVVPPLVKMIFQALQKSIAEYD